MTGVQDKKSKQRQTFAKLSLQAERAMALLKAKIEKLQKKLAESRINSRESLLAQVRQIQNDPKWLRQVRAQYSKEVSQRTLELNETLPVHVE